MLSTVLAYGRCSTLNCYLGHISIKLIKFLDSFEHRKKAKVSVMSYSLNSMDYTVHPGQNTGVGSLSLLQGIFPTQRSNPGLPRCRQILLPAEPQGKPKNTGVGGLFLFQQIFPIQESNRGLLHCRQILYQLNYQGSHAKHDGSQKGRDRPSIGYSL